MPYPFTSINLVYLKYILFAHILCFSTYVYAQDKETMAKSYYLNAVSKYDEGLYKDAIEGLEKVVSLMNSSNPNTQYYLIKSYLALQDPQHVKDNLLGDYFDKYPHADNDPMYQEMLMLISTIDDEIEQANIAITEKYKSNVESVIRWDDKNKYSSAWRDMLLNGELIERLQTAKEDAINYRNRIGNTNWKSTERYAPSSYTDLMTYFIGLNRIYCFYCDHSRATLVKKWEKYKIKHETITLKDVTKANSKPYYTTATYTQKGVAVSSITSTGKFRKDNEYIGLLAGGFADIKSLQNDSVYLFRISALFNYQPGDHDEYSNATDISLILEKENGERLNVFRLIYFRDLDKRNSKNSKCIKYYVNGEEVLKYDGQNKNQAYILLSKNDLQFWILPDYPDKTQYNKREYTGTYTSAFFVVANKCSVGDVHNFKTVELNIESLDVNHIIDLMEQRHALLGNIATKN